MCTIQCNHKTLSSCTNHHIHMSNLVVIQFLGAQTIPWVPRIAGQKCVGGTQPPIVGALNELYEPYDLSHKLPESHIYRGKKEHLTSQGLTQHIHIRWSFGKEVEWPPKFSICPQLTMCSPQCIIHHDVWPPITDGNYRLLSQSRSERWAKTNHECLSPQDGATSLERWILVERCKF